jgi:hypothetical protein
LVGPSALAQAVMIALAFGLNVSDKVRASNPTRSETDEPSFAQTP